MEEANLMDMFKKFSESVCTSTVVLSPDTLSPTPSTSSAMKTQKHTEENPDDPDMEISKWNTPVIRCTVQI
jgi:hypothetical protein